MELAALGQEARAPATDVGIVYFEDGASELTTRSREVLDNLPRLLSLDGETAVVIRSHDGDPALSERRAEAVQDYLAAHGITETRVIEGGARTAGGVALSGGGLVVISTADPVLR